MTFQQICKDVHMVKTNGQQVFIESRNRPPPRKHASTGEFKAFAFGEIHESANSKANFLFSGDSGATKAANSDPIRDLIADVTQPSKALVPAQLVQKDATTGYSYQQINCLDSIVRYVGGATPSPG